MKFFFSGRTKEYHAISRIKSLLIRTYDAGKIRKELRRRDIRAMIPERAFRPGTKRRKKGPHPRFDKQA